MKVTLHTTTTSSVPTKELNIEKMVKAMFKRAKRIGEDEIKF